MAKPKKLKTKNIKQVVTFKATPRAVYELLMDSKKHAWFSGSAAKMSRKVGGTFSAYDGWINGKNVKIIPNKLIVQKWRGADWPEGHYSEVTFHFTKTKAGSKLVFGQMRVPAKKAGHISKGWKSQYWDKMKVWLGEKKPSKKV